MVRATMVRLYELPIFASLNFMFLLHLLEGIQIWQFFDVYSLAGWAASPMSSSLSGGASEEEVEASNFISLSISDSYPDRLQFLMASPAVHSEIQAAGSSLKFFQQRRTSSSFSLLVKGWNDQLAKLHIFQALSEKQPHVQTLFIYMTGCMCDCVQQSATEILQTSSHITSSTVSCRLQRY